MNEVITIHSNRNLSNKFKHELVKCILISMNCVPTLISMNCVRKIKLFPATLKDASLRQFMGLGEYTIRTWDDMKKTFLKKYQDYCRSRESKDVIFKM